MRKLMWFTVGFGAVCALCAYGRIEWLTVGFTVCAALSAVLWLCAMKWDRLRIGSLLFFGCAAAFIWFGCYEGVYLASALGSDGQTLTATVTASDYSYETDYGCAVEGTVTLDSRTFLVRVYLDESDSLKPGDRVSGSFRFRFTSDGGSSDPTYHRGEGIFLLLYQNGTAQINACESIPAVYYPAVWRNELLHRLDEIFPEDAAGFAKALLLGDRSGLGYETQTAFKVSGISHIVAVSGLHLSILYGMLYSLTLRRRFLTLLVSVPSLILFAAMVGFTPSVTRACIMLILMILAQTLRQEYDQPTSLAFAALVMLTVNPMVITSVSFQLSVGCMIGIFLFSRRIQLWFQDPRRMGSAKGRGVIPRLKRWFISSVSVTLSATVITTPLAAYYFGTVSLVSVLTNLLTLWVISFIFYGIIACIAVSFIAIPVSTFLASLTAIPIRFVILVAKTLASLPMAAVYTESVYTVLWLVLCYLLLAAYLLIKHRYALIFFCCVVITLSASVAASWAEPLLYECHVTVLDVGQGQSILLQGGGKTYLVDCGGNDSEEAADKAAQTLLSRGIHRLDGVIVTHYDDDHAGGIPYLLTRVDTDLLLLPRVADENGVAAQLETLANVRYVEEDILFSFADAKLRVIGPISYDSGNESSLCVLFQTENCDILITGDRSTKGELFLLYEQQLPQLELLIAGHHGSAGSAGEALLAATQPQNVIISVGRNNHYGHPAQQLLDRLAAYGCQVYRTDQNGTIIFRR